MSDNYPYLLASAAETPEEHRAEARRLIWRLRYRLQQKEIRTNIIVILEAGIRYHFERRHES